MLFNSVEFVIFLPIVFSIYWLLGSNKKNLQNLFLLGASYVFYGWWDYRFLLLIILSSVIDYIVGLQLHRSSAQKKRKALLFVSLGANLGLLGIFKYYNFFIASFAELVQSLGGEAHFQTLNIILPVGISFYTFQTMSYTIDIYRKKIEPTENWITFFVFVTYFPQLVAGPIERAKNLLPQFENPRVFKYDQAKDGLRQILWGLFKKVVIADTSAIYANEIFNNYANYSSPMLLLGAIYFTFQIYGDFSGYSDIAIGTSKLFGIQLMRNFKNPYFSRDIAEFWRRWHVSLSTWFRDYLYIPLGGSQGGTAKKIRNVFAIFIVSGFWHGANWTFIFWGFLNALYFIPLMLLEKNRDNMALSRKWFPSMIELRGMAITFSLTVLAWIFFRSPNLTDAFGYIAGIFRFDFSLNSFFQFKYVPFILLLLAWEWLTKESEHGLQIDRLPVFARWIIYYILILLICRFAYIQQTFIYFQF